MRKRIVSIVLCLCMVIALLPTVSAAFSQTYVKSMDLTIEMPQAGMTQWEGQELKLLSANTAYGDLLAKGAVMLLKVRWDGEFDRTDRANPKFQAGLSYIATIQIHFVFEEGYVANHQIVNGNYHMNSDLFKVTVNGVDAETEEGSPGNPTMKVNLTIPAPELSDEEKAAAAAARQEKFDLRHAALRSTASAYTTAQADALWVEKQDYGTLILNDSTLPDPLYKDEGYVSGDFLDGVKHEFYLKDRTLNLDYVTGLLIDFDFARFANDYQAETFTKNPVFLCDNLKEIWLSDKVDAVQFLQHLKSATEGNGTGLEKWYWTNSTSFGTAAATLYISSAAAEKVRAAYADDYNSIMPCFSIKVYDGDVYTAQKSGTARDYCTSHKYTAVIMAADRIANLSDCQSAPCWYYSCTVCGKCEYNDNHTINRDYMNANAVPKADHDYQLRLATDEAYVGVNAAGDQVYWYSCIYCGKPYNYHQEHLTQQDMINSGSTELTFKEWNARKLSALKQRETDALNRTTSQVDMFVLSAKSSAKTSAWAQSDVNLALDNNLLDTALLGNDYTRSISRLQFCSVAVRLAEELAGHEISPAPSGTFTDTDSLYVRKAYASGITSGVSATTFDPNGTLTRQQIAAFLYRALQYVAANSDYRYTSYTSKLSSYADSGQIQPWAKEAMAFMNALDLVKGTGNGLSPNGTCTIEQAVAVAYRSIYAHQIGWYQATENVRYQYGAGGLETYITLVKGDRIWVTGGRLGSGVDDTSLDNAKGGYRSGSSYLPVAEPITGEVCYISSGKLKPVRD